MSNIHNYSLLNKWTGNLGTGTNHYRSYARSHTITIEGKPELVVSSDPAFRGDPAKYNPEELLLAALSGCHLMSYLHVCVQSGVIVIAYEDHAAGTMIINSDGSGHFTEVVLHPKVTVANPEMIEMANTLHHKANQLCFIANSVNFKIFHHPACISI